MSIQRFLLVCVAWTLLCLGFVEPVWVAPLFDSQTWIELAFNSHLSEGGTPGLGLQLGESLAGPDSISDDHFRLLALLYMGVPCVIGLTLQMLFDLKGQRGSERLH